MENNRLKKNLTPKELPGKTAQQRRSLMGHHLTQLGTANRQEVTPEQVALYSEALSDIGDTQLNYAFRQALKHLGEFLPSIQQLRTYAEQWRPVAIMDSKHILERPAKPPDWDPHFTIEDVRRELQAVDGLNRFGGRRGKS